MNINPFCAGGLYPAQPWPYGTGCDCCSDASTCTECIPGVTDPSDSPDHPTLPCCRGGNCSQCQCIAGDIPWLMPKAIGCGRIHRCADSWSDVGTPSQYLILCNSDNAHANLEGQLDGNRLPGRPPHTITCIHATGIYSRARDPSGAAPADCAAAGSNIIINPANGYDMVLRVEIPLEVIIRDCCGNQYCLKSFLIDEIRIPLCVRAQLVRDSSDYLFLKARVRLCTPYSVPAAASTNACSAASRITIGPDTLRLELLAEACVVKLVPYGVLGYDPYSCQPPKYN